MTDERLAETWVGENGFGSDCNNINSVDANREMVNAFLEGLKAGRPEWHKVADGDLPKYDVLADDISITVLNQNGNKVFYNFLEKVWKLETSNKISKVIAWCEIPTFTDKE